MLYPPSQNLLFEALNISKAPLLTRCSAIKENCGELVSKFILGNGHRFIHENEDFLDSANNFTPGRHSEGKGHPVYLYIRKLYSIID